MSLLEKTDQGGYLVWCTACKTYHDFDKRWTFNGNMEKPTFRPSLRVAWSWWVDGKKQERCCHSYLTNGVWEYRSDSTHKFAGQDIPLTEGPG